MSAGNDPHETATAQYRDAFELFVAHTDEKDREVARLEQLVDALAYRRVFVDAGAGDGKITARLAARFARTIAIEPNPWLRETLARAFKPDALLPQGILEAEPGDPADLVLCSHVLYHVPEDQWPECMRRMASWLTGEGTLAVVLENPRNDVMRMMDHFSGRRFDLAPSVQKFLDESPGGFATTWEIVPARVEAPDLATARAIAGFLLDLPGSVVPSAAKLETYLHRHFSAHSETYHFSVDQDLLCIRRSR